MVIAEQRAVAGDELEQVRHLLEVGRHARVVAPEVDVVELHVDHVLDPAVRSVERAAGAAAAGGPPSGAEDAGGASSSPMPHAGSAASAAMAMAAILDEHITSTSIPGTRRIVTADRRRVAGAMWQYPENRTGSAPRPMFPVVDLAAFAARARARRPGSALRPYLTVQR
ncbi:MAG TPA: hypothetical protein VFT22_28775 [Kofleriaceae bacterium]|nr:hypothetical protein [Kofleriaceae bacterium]